MHNEQHSLPHGADPVPSLLTVDPAVFPYHQIRIGEHSRGGFKIDTSVLLLI
jgi:hypothetical protein